ncbi:MAG: ribonuclease E/G [Micropepsaceae bacterium]
MSKRMLVDASHQEETRVVILDGNKVEEFDYESASRRPLKGNIYLAKVTRVEPSLQACFVEYGGNRHGFLAFSEIHPDYYQIPTADRQALLEATRSSEREEDESEDVPTGTQREPGVEEASEDPDDQFEGSSVANETGEPGEIVEVVADQEDDVWIHDPETAPDGDKANAKVEEHSHQHETAATDEPTSAPDAAASSEHGDVQSLDDEDAPAGAKKSRDDDAMEELPRREHRSYRRYKIQEVIKRRQVLLIQVVKEERGNKGAALTTYLSLAGRYCVLMPNTDRGGGISRKISNVADRRKLKEMAGELEVPEGMGVIIRTAGANRTRQEIRRDFEYLLRQWDSVRDLTLRSSAPTLVYEEGSLIKRTIRDLFSKEIDEVLVEGERGYKEAHGFMTMLMPSHSDSVKHYRDAVPMFQRYGVEAALDGMFNPIVRLRSGGYIVINQTEALVAVDVNSGKSTREHHIEDTALKTNLEAAEEIARQLRLRDLAGLVVIDFIDMEEHRNNRSVEKRLKDSLRHDRARIQLGRISPFGLLEMSRQRLRAGMIEGATTPCPHCEGRGVIRSVGSMALRVLRAIEEYCQHEKVQAVTLRVPPEVAMYILNHKRAQLTAIEDRNDVYIYMESQSSLAASAYEIERGSAVPFEPRKAIATAVTVESELETRHEEDEDDQEDDDDTPDTVAGDREEEARPASGSPNEQGDGRKKRRRRRRGRDRDAPRGEQVPGSETQPGVTAAQPDDAASFIEQEGADSDADDEQADLNAGSPDISTAEGAEGQRRRRRRGRRGRRGRRDGESGSSPDNRNGIGNLPTPAEALDAPDWPGTGGFATSPGAVPQATRRQDAFEPYSGLRHAEAPVPVELEPRASEPKQERASIASFFGFGPKSESKLEQRPEPRPETRTERDTETVEEAGSAEQDSDQPKKRGWWQKRSEG